MHKPTCDKMSWCRRAMMLLFSVYLSLAVAFAQSDTTRVFSESSPLIYEDVWDLWPYSFLNDNGDPDGFNVPGAVHQGNGHLCPTANSISAFSFEIQACHHNRYAHTHKQVIQQIYSI